MPNLLKQLELEELSLVDVPANAQAMVTLFKRDTGENMEDEFEKMSDDMKGRVKAYMDKGYGEKEAMRMAEEDMKKKADEETQEVDTLKAENERLRKALLDAGFVIKAESIEKKAPEEFIEYEGEKINKADVPAPILKALEAAEEERKDVALTKRAESELPNFSTEVAKKFLKALDHVEEDSEELLKALHAADKAFGANMEEVGKSGSEADMEDAADKIEKLAKEYMKDHGGSIASARAAVYKTDEGKALVKELYKKD